MRNTKYYTIYEISKMLKVSYLTVYRWIKAGKLQSNKAGKQYRIREEILNKFLTIRNK